MDVSWHLGQETQLVEQNVFRAKGASHGLTLVPVQGHGWAEEVRREAWSPAYGQKAPMTVVNFGTTADVPAEFATLIVALDEVHPQQRSFTRTGGQETDATVRGYHYADEAAEYFFYFAPAGKPWRMSSVSSDAEFVCWSKKPGSPDQLLVLCNGSYTEIEGGPEVRCRKAVRWCELSAQGGQTTVQASDPEALEAVPENSSERESAPKEVDG